MNPPPPKLSILAPLLAALAAIGPFTIDTYLPAFPEMMADLGASQLDIQQSLTAYLLPFAFMALWHGAISDALGRRPVVIFSLIFFILGSLGAAGATSIEHLWLARALQGISAGAGMVVSRAVVRDILDGPAAHKVMAQGAMMFALAPAIAPITGGWLLAALGWRSIFIFLALYGLALIFAIIRWLPETLPVDKRQSLHPVKLARSYAEVFSNPAFLGQSGALAANFLGFFLYVLSAPVFLIEHLGLSSQGFGWLFVPTVSGMMLGSWWSARLAGKLSPVGCLHLSYKLMIAAAAANVMLNAVAGAQLPWAVLPVMLYTFGMAIGTPALQLLIIDLYPQKRGMVASCQGFMQSGANTLGAAVLAPLLWTTPLKLAAGMAGLVLLGRLMFRFGQRRHPEGKP